MRIDDRRTILIDRNDIREIFRTWKDAPNMDGWKIGMITTQGYDAISITLTPEEPCLKQSA